LADLGNSVIIIEHNLDVIRNADWVLDLGPEGGEDGGRVVGEGRPAKIAATPDSYTGQFLKRYYSSTNGKLAEVEPDDDVVSVETNAASTLAAATDEGKPIASSSARGKRTGKAKSDKPATPRRKKTGRP
jgi:excinuclease ABC subunit A